MLLTISAILTVLMGIVHSLLGERWIFSPLRNKWDLPALQGSVSATKRTLRFTWHITTVLGFGIAAILFSYASLPSLGPEQLLVLRILAISYLVSFVVALVGSKGRHPSWIVFLVVGVLLYLASPG